MTPTPKDTAPMDTANPDQAEFWGTSPSGAKWITHQAALDAALAPVLDLVLDRAGLAPGMSVLDIGCGTGASVLEISDRVGPSGDVLGLDISAPFLDLARTRSAGRTNVAFELADAQVAPLAPQARDAVVSRFGVMFFSDTAAAFANIARALKPGAAMTFAAWGPAEANPWFAIPGRAAAGRLGSLPPPDLYSPGPMAFADADRILAFFAEAGLSAEVDKVDLHLTPAGGVTGAAAISTQVGAVSRFMANADGTPEDLQAIEAAIAEAYAAFDTEDGVRVPARIHLFQARHP